MKAYQTPQLVEYGDVSLLTAASAENLSDDLFFGISGPPIQGNGSFDGCITFPGTSDCVNPQAP